MSHEFGTGGGEQNKAQVGGTAQDNRAGMAPERFNVAELKDACWIGFCGCVNHFISQGKYTDKLVMNYQGTDCRITALNLDGTCQIDVPGAERHILPLRQEDCTRLLGVMCDVPPSYLNTASGSGNKS